MKLRRALSERNHQQRVKSTINFKSLLNTLNCFPQSLHVENHQHRQSHRWANRKILSRLIKDYAEFLPFEEIPSRKSSLCHRQTELPPWRITLNNFHYLCLSRKSLKIENICYKIWVHGKPVKIVSGWFTRWDWGEMLCSWLCWPWKSPV